jgi:dTDP-glucose 4,6-dehydratase
MKRILITGVCGFMGHHLAEHIFKVTDWEIVGIDKLTYASSGFDRLRDIKVFDKKRLQLFTYDFTKPFVGALVAEFGKIDYIIHLGAETHVDRSIEDPEPFVMTNVVGTMRILDLARKLKPERMIYFSTDEVFGPAPADYHHSEWDAYNSSNPYAASKAGGEELCLAYANTYKVPIVITHTMNLIGERQHPEKFVPSTIRKVLNGEEVIIHANKDLTEAGSRFYLHCRNAADALLFIIELTVGNREKFNIVGEREVSNLDMAEFIARVLNKPLIHKMVSFHESRPGHDLRYALSGAKMRSLGWKPPMNLEESLTNTIHWYLKNPKWLEI